MNKHLNDIIKLASDAPRHEPAVELPDGTIIQVKRPADAEIDNILALTRGELSASTVPLDVIKAVHKHNTDTLWGVYRASDASKRDLRIIGYYSFLHLNEEGRARLEQNTFDGSHPDLSLVVPTGERPAAVYVWAVVARGVARVGTPLICRALGRNTYGGVPIYATAATTGGLNAAKRYGFGGAHEAEGGLGHLFRLDQAPAGPTLSMS